MEFTKEQLIKIKEQLIGQIKTSFPEDEKESKIKQIQEMDDSQLIDFLKQNNLIQQKETSDQQCIFCSLIFGDVPSTKISENEKAIAILELNPISEGHTIILPKDHISDPTTMPQEAKNLANEIKEKLQKTFNPKRIDLINSETMGHQAINVLPVYTEETLNSQRYQKTPEQLAELKKKIQDSQPEQIKQKAPPEKLHDQKPKQEKINEKDFWLPVRIP